MAIELSPLGARGRGAQLTSLGLKSGGSVGIRLSQKGISLVEQHLARFGDDAANTMMMERLHNAFAGGRKVFGADRDFYMHELYEGTLMNRGISYPLSHMKALQRYGVPQMGLYHPTVVKYLHKTQGMFSEAYLKYWGIP